MSRTIMSGSTNRSLSFQSGNWECAILGRVAALMKTRHYHKITLIRSMREKGTPWWFYVTQPYRLDAQSCAEFAQALIHVTDKVVEKIHPHTHTFIGTKEELREQIVYLGRRYARLKKGYWTLS